MNPKVIALREPIELRNLVYKLFQVRQKRLPPAILSGQEIIIGPIDGVLDPVDIILQEALYEEKEGENLSLLSLT